MPAFSVLAGSDEAKVLDVPSASIFPKHIFNTDHQALGELRGRY